MKEQLCNDGDSIIMGKYWLNSNLWGAQTGSGSQCLWDTSSNGSNIAWGTEWDWTGQYDAVKSYNCAVLGWHWGWKLPNTELPLQLSAHQNIYTSWIFDLTQTTPGGINVSYDLWLSANPHLGNASADTEIMIWLYRDGDISPVGSKKTTITIAGIDWDLWEGSVPAGWSVYSFVRTSNTSSQSLNLNDFFDLLISRGLNDSTYLISIEAGTEVFTGAGRLDTTSYSVNIGGTAPRP
jgi:xyloglucan-specific endo-beta-1,4-glucanase